MNLSCTRADARAHGLAADYDEGDLLKVNPNHVGAGWESGDDGDAEEVDPMEEDDVESLAAGIRQVDVADGTSLR